MSSAPQQTQTAQKPSVVCRHCSSRVLKSNLKEHNKKCPKKPKQKAAQQSVPKAVIQPSAKKPAAAPRKQIQPRPKTALSRLKQALSAWTPGAIVKNPAMDYQNVSSTTGSITYTNSSVLPADFMFWILPGYQTPIIFAASTPGSQSTLVVNNAPLPLLPAPPTIEGSLNADWTRDYPQVGQELTAGCDVQSIEKWNPLAVKCQFTVTAPMTTSTGFVYANVKEIQPRLGQVPYNVAPGTPYTLTSPVYNGHFNSIQIPGNKAAVKTIAVQQNKTGSVKNGTVVKLAVYPEEISQFSYPPTFTPQSVAVTAAMTAGATSNAVGQGLVASPAGTYPANTIYRPAMAASMGRTQFIINDVDSQADLTIPGALMPPSLAQQINGGLPYFTTFPVLGMNKIAQVLFTGLAPGTTVQLNYARLDTCVCQTGKPENAWQVRNTGPKEDGDDIFPRDSFTIKE